MVGRVRGERTAEREKSRLPTIKALDSALFSLCHMELPVSVGTKLLTYVEQELQFCSRLYRSQRH